MQGPAFPQDAKPSASVESQVPGSPGLRTHKGPRLRALGSPKPRLERSPRPPRLLCPTRAAWSRGCRPHVHKGAGGPEKMQLVVCLPREGKEWKRSNRT